MTTAAKRNLSDAMTWILRSMTAVGSLFLFSIYTEIREQGKMIRDMQIKNGSETVGNEWKFRANDSDHRRYEYRLDGLESNLQKLQQRQIP